MIGYITALTGTVLAAGIDFSDLWLGPVIEAAAPEIFDQPSPSMILGLVLTYAIFHLGWLLLAVAIARSGAAPRKIAWTLLVGAGIALLSVSGLPGLNVVLYVALVWIGWHVLAADRARID